MSLSDGHGQLLGRLPGSALHPARGTPETNTGPMSCIGPDEGTVAQARALHLGLAHRHNAFEEAVIDRDPTLTFAEGHVVIALGGRFELLLAR